MQNVNYFKLLVYNLAIPNSGITLKIMQDLSNSHLQNNPDDSELSNQDQPQDLDKDNSLFCSNCFDSIIYFS